MWPITAEVSTTTDLHKILDHCVLFWMDQWTFKLQLEKTQIGYCVKHMQY